mgnify:CR=1 FL=1
MSSAKKKKYGMDPRSARGGQVIVRPHPRRAGKADRFEDDR